MIARLRSIVLRLPCSTELMYCAVQTAALGKRRLRQAHAPAQLAHPRSEFLEHVFYACVWSFAITSYPPVALSAMFSSSPPSRATTS
jgi:hypothetical protein